MKFIALGDMSHNTKCVLREDLEAPGDYNVIRSFTIVAISDIYSIGLLNNSSGIVTLLKEDDLKKEALPLL